MKLFGCIASILVIGAQAEIKKPTGVVPNQFNQEDLASIRGLKFDHVMFKTKKDCALDNYPDVSASFLLNRHV